MNVWGFSIYVMLTFVWFRLGSIQTILERAYPKKESE